MARLFKPSEVLQCKLHTDCMTRARIITWDCGCVEVQYTSRQNHSTPCEDFGDMARKIEHRHDQEQVLLEMREDLRRQQERILVVNSNRGIHSA